MTQPYCPQRHSGAIEFQCAKVPRDRSSLLVTKIRPINSGRRGFRACTGSRECSVLVATFSAGAIVNIDRFMWRVGIDNDLCEISFAVGGQQACFSGPGSEDEG